MMMRKQLHLILLLSLAYGCTNMSSIKNQHRNVYYANLSKAQCMDIFIPNGEGPFPAMLLIHGGGFKSGDKKGEYTLAKKLVAHNYVAICVNYRLSQEATFPAAVHDIKAAIRYVRAHANKYAVNPDKIGCWGSSAGGNLSAMMGTSHGNHFLEGNIGTFKNESTEIQACVNWFGPIDFSKMTGEAKELDFGDRFNMALESAYLGAEVSDPKNANVVQQANPATYIDVKDPPFYVQAGNKDPLIPYLQSQNFAKALSTVLGEEKVHFDLIEGAGHGGSEFSSDTNVIKIISFLDKHLK